MILLSSCSKVAASSPGFTFENSINRWGGQGNTKVSDFGFPLCKYLMLISGMVKGIAFREVDILILTCFFYGIFG